LTKNAILGKYKEIEVKISRAAESITTEINKCKGDCTFKMVEE
jgi:hypothetical protein